MLFCDTPIQSLIVALGSGLIGGIVAISTNQPMIGIIIAAGIAYITELVLHEIREDPQYEEAKQELIRYLKEK